MTRTTTHTTVLALSLVMVACGGGGRSPTSPTPSIAQVAGLWSFTARLTSVSGGECVGSALRTAVGSVETGTVSITQAGQNLTARSTSGSTGLSCDYTGTAGRASFSLNATRCDGAVVVDLRCASGAPRDMELVATGIDATVSGASISGTSAETWNVFVAGTSRAVGIMTVTSTVTATRR